MEDVTAMVRDEGYTIVLLTDLIQAFFLSDQKSCDLFNYKCKCFNME